MFFIGCNRYRFATSLMLKVIYSVSFSIVVTTFLFRDDNLVVSWVQIIDADGSTGTNRRS